MCCRYLVASSPKTIYVSFIGTKLAKDVLVDANFLHRPLWQAPNSKQVRADDIFARNIHVQRDRLCY
jgi:hypothetical protein